MNRPAGGAQRETIHRGVKFDLELVTIPGPGGTPIKREVVRHPGAVVILPILEEPGGGRQVVLIRNERIAVGRTLWELPAGTLEPMEKPEECAPRELEEETGYRAATLTPLARFHTTPGLTDELMHAFVATGLTHVGQRLEADERLTVHPRPVAEALAMVDSGEMTDAKSMLTLLMAVRNGIL
ncbi:MAG: NUDIX hydrolase [Phycisphaerales bacterium]